MGPRKISNIHMNNRFFQQLIMSRRTRTLRFPYVHLLLLILLPYHYHRRHHSHAAPAMATGGKWDLLQSNIGITAMHMQLLNNDKVVIYDRTDFGLSNISLPNGRCRNDPNERAVKLDCTAHSVEYDVAANTIRPLTVLTDVWCSSGAVMSDGTFIQTGGFNDGDHVVRIYKPCSSDDVCDWQEINNGLIQRRWYSTNHILPDGRQIIIGGRRQFNYEFYPKTPGFDKVFNLSFLVQTNAPVEESNLYPFVFLNTDGNLFIFANNRAILFNYSKNVVVKIYPQIPGGDPRCYPNTGSAVLLPLKINLQGGGAAPAAAIEAEVMVCGGGPRGAYTDAQNGNFTPSLNTCGRIKISDQNPQWIMETMPMPRLMGDMLLLPNGNVLIINGASAGSAGWEYGRNPIKNPVLYKPNNPIGTRFEIQNSSTIPRMYHSTAILLRDGRVLVGGSNPHMLYNFTNVLYPTELRLEAFSPSYLDSLYDNIRPKILLPISHSQIKYGQPLIIRFTVSGFVQRNLVKVSMVSPSFNTHSFSMNQRLLVLGEGNVKLAGNLKYRVNVTAPSTANLAPPGYYLLFVVHQDIPSVGIWIQLFQ